MNQPAASFPPVRRRLRGVGLGLFLGAALAASRSPAVRAFAVESPAADAASQARVSDIFAPVPQPWAGALASYLPAGAAPAPVAMMLQAGGYSVGVDPAGRRPVLMRGTQAVPAEVAAGDARRAQIAAHLLVNGVAQKLIARSRSARLSPAEELDVAARLSLLSENAGLSRYLTQQRVFAVRDAQEKAVEALSDASRAKVEARMRRIAQALGRGAEPDEDALSRARSLVAGGESFHPSLLAPAEPMAAADAAGVRVPEPPSVSDAPSGGPLSRFLARLGSVVGFRAVPSPVVPLERIGGFHPRAFDFQKGIKIPAVADSRLRRIAAKYGVRDFASDDFAGLIGAVYDKLALIDRAPRDQTPALYRGGRMAEFAAEIEFAIKSEPDRRRRALRFTLAEDVLLLEAWKPSEFKSGGILKWPASGRLHFSDYMSLLASYVRKTAPFTEIRYSDHLSTTKEMRDMTSHNLWPIDLEGHDIRHVHYALGHPTAAAVYFRASRSKNNFRYAMVGNMYEGLDVVQFPREAGLARYMKEKMGMDLEEAMVYLGKATNTELLRVAGAARVLTDTNKVAAEVADWAPSKVAANPDSDAEPYWLESEVDDMIGEFEGYLRSERYRRVTNYQINPAKGGARRDDNSIHVRTKW